MKGSFEAKDDHTASDLPTAYEVGSRAESVRGSLGLAAEREVIESEVQREVDRREQERLEKLGKPAEFD